MWNGFFSKTLKKSKNKTKQKMVENERRVNMNLMSICKYTEYDYDA